MLRGFLTPQLSVIVVNFNSGTALAGTLASLAAGLAGIEWDAVVVDNASADGSERAADSNPRVRLLRKTSNVGFAAGVNAGMAATSAPFLLLLNPDCRLEPRFGVDLLSEMENHPACGVLGPIVRDPSGSLQESARGDPNMLTGLFGRTSLLPRLFPNVPAARRNLASSALSTSDGSSHQVDWVSGACMLVRREALVEVGGFDEGYFLTGKMQMSAGVCGRQAGKFDTHLLLPSSTMSASRAGTRARWRIGNFIGAPIDTFPPTLRRSNGTRAA